MSTVSCNPNVLRSCCECKRTESLQNISEQLDSCQKNLTNYLDSKRNIFARFYFISDDELLEFLGSSSVPNKINAQIKKLFENVQKINFNENNCAFGLCSSEGEFVHFKQKICANGDPERWMTKIEDEIASSLWAYTKEAIYSYGTEKRLAWITKTKTLGMNTIIGSQIWWTWRVENAYESISHKSKDALQKLEVTLTQELSDMVAMVRSSLDVITRKKVNTLLIIDIHAKDIVSSFIRESITSSNSFEWESQLRFYWNRDENDIIVKQCTGCFRYGYEYLGLSSRLVITPLTDR